MMGTIKKSISGRYGLSLCENSNRRQLCVRYGRQFEIPGVLVALNSSKTAELFLTGCNHGPVLSTSTSIVASSSSTKIIKEKSKKKPKTKGSGRLKEKGIVARVWPTESGSIVKVLTRKKTDQEGGHDFYCIQVDIEGIDSDMNEAPEILWGVYRSSPSVWQHPESIVADGTIHDEDLGIARTPMINGPGSSWTKEFRIPSHLGPLNFSFNLRILNHDLSTKLVIKPLIGEHFSALLGLGQGKPSPAGPSMLAPDTVNFSVRSRGGETISLILLKPPKQGNGHGSWGQIEIALDPVLNRTGDQWHIAIPGIQKPESVRYGWRVDGDISWESGFRIQPDSLLLDPFAPSITYYPSAPPTPCPAPTISIPDKSKLEELDCFDATMWAKRSAIALSALGPDDTISSEWSKDGSSSQLNLPLESLRVLEVDPYIFSQGSQVEHPGTFLGVSERINYIKALGINAIVLSSANASSFIDLNEGKHRAPITYMAPDPNLSTDSSSSTLASVQLRHMVSELHAAGIEVIISIDPTFLVDGTDLMISSALSLRGLDYPAYFRPNGVLNCGKPPVHDILLSMMRRWAIKYGVDGFYFLSAENLAQDSEGMVVDAPSFAEAICKDPLLARLKLIAAPSDSSLLPRGGIRGFPHWAIWQERNHAFQRDIISYIVENTSGILDSVSKRLTGSSDIFSHGLESDLPGNLAAARRPCFSFNAISKPHGTGFSIKVIVEEAAGSAGAAAMSALGPEARLPNSKTILKSMLVALLLSQGVPCLSSNDVYDVEIARFVGVVMRLRSKFESLLLPTMFDSPRDITWYGENGGEPDWSSNHGSNLLSFVIRDMDGGAILIAFNPSPIPVTMILPPVALSEGGYSISESWKRAVDTSLEAPKDAELLEKDFQSITGSSYTIAAKAAIVLVAGSMGIHSE